MSNAAMGQKPPVKWMQLFLNEPLADGSTPIEESQGAFV